MATDNYQSFVSSPDSFGTMARVITPSNDDIDPIAKGVVCLTAGDITIVPSQNEDGDTVTFTNVPVGFIPPYRVRRVTAATATVATIDG